MLSPVDDLDPVSHPMIQVQQDSEQSPARLRRPGFTLLEVLIALAILSVAMLALHQAFATNIYMTIYTRDLWSAVVFTRNELMRVERGSPPSIGVSDGVYNEGHKMAGYHWKRAVTDEEPFPGIKVRKVSLELIWEEGIVPRSYKSEVYVLPK